jgi:hypothetical protein
MSNAMSRSLRVVQSHLYGTCELLTSSLWGYCVFPGRSRIVRVTHEIPHILAPSSLIHSDRFDPANATCYPPASHRSIPVGYLLRWQRRGVGAALSTALEAVFGEVLFRHARLLCLGVGTHISRKGSLAVSGNVKAATMPARAAAMR